MQLPFANLQVKYQNPHATAPLILPVTVICNTPDEELHANIRTNSRRKAIWVKQEPAHSLVAVLCGSGPSLQDSIEDIRQWQADGATIFSMNGSAAFLHQHGILADYQVMIDPRPITASLVGPARQHLFASQVHPSCFEKAPDAIVWHLQIEGIDDLFPDVYPEHVLLGGAASVGNTATCLAYAMGYRTLHLYGYDSSHRNGQGHAFHQKINDGDPCAKVAFNGKEYFTSLTMKLQAERFQETGRELERAGCTLHVHGEGLLPDMWNTPSELLTEREKYQRMWAVQGYRTLSPGEDAVPQFLAAIGDERGRLLDIGCGTGRAGVKLKEAGFDVILMDFTDNSRDYQALDLPFLQHDITQPFPIQADYGFCADVMEHIPTEQVPAVLGHILQAVKQCWFQISTVPDNLGALINQDLHLTVQPKAWWVQQINAAGGVVMNAQELEGAVQLYVVSTH